MAAAGLTNRQGADRLFLAEGSVKNCWSSRLHKLNAQSRVEAIAIARARGIID